MTLWPAAGLLLLAAGLHFIAPVTRRRWVTVILYLAAAASAACAFGILLAYEFPELPTW
jgi:hypothetical protein